MGNSSIVLTEARQNVYVNIIRSSRQSARCGDSSSGRCLGQGPCALSVHPLVKRVREGDPTQVLDVLAGPEFKGGRRLPVGDLRLDLEAGGEGRGLLHGEGDGECSQFNATAMALGVGRGRQGVAAGRQVSPVEAALPFVAVQRVGEDASV